MDSSQNVAGAIINACDAAGNGPGCSNSDWTSQPALPAFWGSEQSDLANTSLSGPGQITASDNSGYCLDNANGSATNGNKIRSGSAWGTPARNGSTRRSPGAMSC